MNSANGKLIVFEGIDGSGKTTVSKLFFDHLIRNNFSASWFREPSDSRWGKKIRALANREESIPIEDEFRYFLEDRKWDVKNNLIPSLRRGEVVVLDRYYFSSACYQGARGLDVEMIIEKNASFAPEPDILFLIDVDVRTALSRIRASRDIEAKLFEKESFLVKVRENYLKLDEAFIRIINGNRPLKEVTSSVIREFERTFLQ